jgi:hypothetical protein
VLFVLVTASPVGERGIGGASEADGAVEIIGDDLEELLKGNRAPGCKVGFALRCPLKYASPPSLPIPGRTSLPLATSIEPGYEAYSQTISPEYFNGCCTTSAIQLSFAYDSIAMENKEEDRWS